MDWVNLPGYAAAASDVLHAHDDSSTHPRSRQQRAVLHLRYFDNLYPVLILHLILI